MTGDGRRLDPPGPGGAGAAEAADPTGDGVFSWSRRAPRRQETPGGEPDRCPPSSAVQDVLDGLPGSVICLEPRFGADGEVEDFRITAASPDALDIGARRGKELVGLSILETYPTVFGTELWSGYVRALKTGVRYEGEPFEYQEVVAGIPRLSRFAVRAAPGRAGLIVSWVRLDSGEREQRRLAVMQRLAKMGWTDWDLVRNRITWSEEVYSIFGRDPAHGPMTLEELPEHVVAEDLPALGGAVQRLLGQGEPVDHTFRILAPDGGTRHIRIVAETETDVNGDPVEVHGAFQDLTAVKQAERQLLEHERAVQAHRTMLTAERSLAARLQHALLPLAHRSLHIAGLTVDVAYRPQQQGVEVGGDWYSAIELPDGDALLVVGDVAGHGLDAVATMAQLRFTAKGMAITGTPLATILARLNTLLLHSSERGFNTATMIMACYEPETGVLTWVQAGHLPLLLLRQGEARYLPSPRTALLGAMPEADYAPSTVRLLPGDQLLLFTDGLVETPGEIIDDGLDRLARTAAACTADDRPLDGILDALVTSGTRRDDVCVLHVRV
ncbi:PP2C family protein-serine/threonine phosphatase [Streptomyces sp. NPDC093094]|uniref:PP2C family protein-serine/threonine phosphatase n=1 Tax=Streptomyces sp. NPDC093094 TaxID=3366026 RepID=UPI0037FE34EA